MACSGFKLERFAQTMAFALAAMAGPATAAIVTLGDVNPDPTGGVVGVLSIGGSATGSVAVNGSNGPMVVEGTGSNVTIAAGSGKAP